MHTGHYHILFCVLSAYCILWYGKWCLCRMALQQQEFMHSLLLLHHCWSCSSGSGRGPEQIWGSIHAAVLLRRVMMRFQFGRVRKEEAEGLTHGRAGARGCTATRTVRRSTSTPATLRRRQCNSCRQRAALSSNLPLVTRHQKDVQERRRSPAALFINDFSALSWQSCLQCFAAPA